MQSVRSPAVGGFGSFLLLTTLSFWTSAFGSCGDPLSRERVWAPKELAARATDDELIEWFDLRRRAIRQQIRRYLSHHSQGMLTEQDLGISQEIESGVADLRAVGKRLLKQALVTSNGIRTVGITARGRREMEEAWVPVLRRLEVQISSNRALMSDLLARTNLDRDFRAAALEFRAFEVEHHGGVYTRIEEALRFIGVPHGHLHLHP